MATKSAKSLRDRDSTKQIRKSMKDKRVKKDDVELQQYLHTGKRIYNPLVGLVTPDTDIVNSAAWIYAHIN